MQRLMLAATLCTLSACWGGGPVPDDQSDEDGLIEASDEDAWGDDDAAADDGASDDDSSGADDDADDDDSTGADGDADDDDSSGADDDTDDDDASAADEDDDAADDDDATWGLFTGDWEAWSEADLSDDAFCTMLGQATCDSLDLCAPEYPWDCRAYYDDRCEHLRDLVDLGALQFNPGPASDCLRLWASVDRCQNDGFTATVSRDDACDDAYSGALSTGHDCGGLSAEVAVCEAGTRCDGAHCVELPAAGESCFDGHRCGDGLYCRFEDRTCQTRRLEGRSCIPYESSCAPGLQCPVTGPHEEICVVTPQFGEECEPGVACDRFLSCSVSLGVCVDDPEEGDDCSWGVDCPADTACRYSGENDIYNGLSRRCLRPLEEGEPCFGGDGCAADLTCEGQGYPNPAVCVPVEEG